LLITYQLIKITCHFNY